MSSTSDTLRADVLVIGFGKGGKTAAAMLARAGRRVVMVEQSARMYGGTCPNVGCIPTKGLVHRSTHRRPDDPPQEFYERAVAEVQAVREMMRSGNFEAMNVIDTVTVVTGRAMFTDPHTVVVSGHDGHITITADVILINTGAEPLVPDIPGLRDSRYRLTSTALIESPVLPGRLTIIGGGYLGIELAGIYQRFGAQVTMLESSLRLLYHQDDDVAAAVLSVLRDDGIQILDGVQVLEVHDDQSGATVVYQRDGHRQEIEADAILAAAGRRPATAGLGLEAASIRTTMLGAVEVDEHLRTSQPHIFALGDVNGGEQHTYISLDDSRIVLDQLEGEGQRSTADRVAIPHTLFTAPPLATVGHSERTARSAGYRIKIASEAVRDIIAMPRAYAVQETRGMMKFIIDVDTDQILGAALLSVDAQELINTVALAIRNGITATQLHQAIYTHPSSTEALNEVLVTIVRSDEPTVLSVPMG